MGCVLFFCVSALLSQMNMTFLSSCELSNLFYLTVTVSYQACEPIVQFIIMACITNAVIGLQYGISGLMGMCNAPLSHIVLILLSQLYVLNLKKDTSR
jgi:hypothetical protein